MEQPELGKTEEEMNAPSSAELSEPETAATPEDGGAEMSAGVNADMGNDASAAAPESSEDAVPEAEAESGDAPAAPEESSEAAEEAAPQPEVPADNGLRRGMLVEGKVSRTAPTEVYVDLGEGREGLILSRELEAMSRKMREGLEEGSDVLVYVVNPRNHRGQIILSVNQAQEELDWRSAEEYRSSKTVFEGRIGGYNKGGLIVRFGQLRGFVPQSQIADTRLRLMEGETPEERYGKMVNEDINVKVMEVDRPRNRLILSERAAMREVRQRRKESLITELEVGEVREGVVVSLENFGAFVDVGGAEGLVHLTELSWKHVTHPRQVLNIGDKVKVKIISVDPDQNRIGLSIKQILPDPWDEIRAVYGEGTLVRGIVTKLTKFGAFAQLQGEISVEGLIHISELSDDRVEHPKDVVKKGDELTLRVVKVDVKNRRLGLSLKRVNSAEYLDRDLERAFEAVESGNLTPLREVPDEAEGEDDEVIEPEDTIDAPDASEAVDNVDEDDEEVVSSPEASAEVEEAEEDEEDDEEEDDEEEDDESSDDSSMDDDSSMGDDDSSMDDSSDGDLEEDD